jgi:hypothetical protein
MNLDVKKRVIVPDAIIFFDIYNSFNFGKAFLRILNSDIQMENCWEQFM